MRYFGAAATDAGTAKRTNQDSVCLKIADTDKYGQAAMAVICDGMGGLEKGELASATVIRRLSDWFEREFLKKLGSCDEREFPKKIGSCDEREFPKKLGSCDEREFPKKLGNCDEWELASEWTNIVRELNYRILEYGRSLKICLGTTLSAMLVIRNKYMVVHVGDSRVYRIKECAEQLTEDQTFVAREIKRGNMTPEQAEKDSRRNMLLQCIGASRTVEPQILFGDMEPDTVYMLCSDGFRHVLSEQEIWEKFQPFVLQSKEKMEQSSRYLIDLVKSRDEKDNISVVLLKSMG